MAAIPPAATEDFHLQPGDYLFAYHNTDPGRQGDYVEKKNEDPKLSPNPKSASKIR
jgi:hypothetical protein